MVGVHGPAEDELVIKFGGGINSRSANDEINDREAADGANFQLDVGNAELKRRAPFDLIGTVPNAAEIRGGGSLLKSDGTVTAVFQAGNTVYSWDGATTFTSEGTVQATAQLRGHWRSHIWQLTDVLLLTDLNLQETVQEWDGSTLSASSFTNEAGTGFGNFYAKYLSVSNERAVFSNIREAAGTFPHLIIGSERGDYTVITVSNRPSSGLSVQDPWFVVAPDNKSINGHVDAFGSTLFSTEKGQIFNLTGSNAKDFSIDTFFPGSYASGSESLAYIGNDVLVGRQGRIESIKDTDRFGDSEANDATVHIQPSIKAYTGWEIVYNGRLNRVYAFPENIEEVWVAQTSMMGQQISPWMKWTTTHALGFDPTFVQSMLDPNDGLEYVFMGDSSGNIYRMEGTGASGDAGADLIATEWLSKLVVVPSGAEVSNLEGQVKYRKNNEVPLTINFEFAGSSITSKQIDFTLQGISDLLYFGGDAYFGGDFYFGTQEDKLSEQVYMVDGQASAVQVRLTTTAAETTSINSINVRFNAANVG